jgi:hypothetical protein
LSHRFYFAVQDHTHPARGQTNIGLAFFPGCGEAIILRDNFLRVRLNNRFLFDVKEMQKDWLTTDLEFGG